MPTGIFFKKIRQARSKVHCKINKNVQSGKFWKNTRDKEANLPDTKTYYKILIIKRVLLMHERKVIHVTIKSLEIDLSTHKNLIIKSDTSNHWRQDGLFNNYCWHNWLSKWGKKIDV